MGKVFVGHDWAEDHHDVFIEDDTGRRLAGGRLPEGVEGIGRFMRHSAPGCSQSSEMPRTATQIPSLARTTPACHPSPKHPANITSCSPDTPATAGSPMPATYGRLPRSPPAPAHGPSTTSTAPEATPTTAPSERWPTDSSASSTTASATKPTATSTPPGATDNNKQLDNIGPWDV